VLPRPPIAGFKGAVSRQEGNEREAIEGLGEGEEGNGGERGNWEGRGKEESWGGQ